MAKTATPAPAAKAELDKIKAVEVTAKQPTRKALLDQLKTAGYAGPTSFTATVLRDVAAWVASGSPKDGNVPKGVLLAIHPDLKPKAPRLNERQRGFREAVAAVDGLGDDLQAIRRWVTDNTAQDDA